MQRSEFHTNTSFGEASGPLVFMHVPKTGGTTLHELLSQHFSSGQICPDRYNEASRTPPEQMRGFAFYSGHFDRSVVDRLPKPHRLITVIREPRARILSLYYYWKSFRPDYARERGLAGPLLADKYSLEEFLHCPEPGIAPNIDNVTVRSMIGDLPTDPGVELSRLDDRCVARAFHFVDTMFDCGITEDLEGFVNRLFPRLGFPVPAVIPRRRSTRSVAKGNTMREVEREAISERVDAALARLTRFDQSLYQLVANRCSTATSGSARRSA